MSNKKTIQFPFILHGGDYNPEQFSEETWIEDIKLMKLAGINIATLPVFGWGNLQTSENEYRFDWLDKVIDLLEEAKIKLCLCTATGATPPWVDQAYPDVLRTDHKGIKQHHGGRHTFCPHSPNFQRLSRNLARKMAERYGKRSNLIIWHVSNEYGNRCYCSLCSEAFRTWLKVRYESLDELNFRWNMAFWGQTFTDWSQIEAPIEFAQRNFQGLLIDYDRFQSESILACCEGEIEELRELTPNIPITTNMMGTFKILDYQKWAKALDIVSWDCYPGRNAPWTQTAFRHALTRGLKNGEPWMLMEQTPSQQNWQAYNSLKRPGILRLWSYQAMAHGADAIMYFQWRRSPGAQEMFHGAVVEHGNSTAARVFKEVSTLGAELKNLGSALLSSRVRSKVALVFDWETWWAVDYSSGPSIDLDYVQVSEKLFAAFAHKGVSVDVIAEDSDFLGYEIILAPCKKMVKNGFAPRIEEFVENGGTFVTTFFSGITDETDRAFPNGYPGPLANVLGIWIEETDALAPNEKNSVTFINSPDEVECGLLCDRIQLRGADSIATYNLDFYAQEPAITNHKFGKGSAFYLGTQLSEEGLLFFIENNLDISDLKARNQLSWTGTQVETMMRESEIGEKFLFILNHGAEPVQVKLGSNPGIEILSGREFTESITIEKFGVAILGPA